MKTIDIDSIPRKHIVEDDTDLVDIDAERVARNRRKLESVDISIQGRRNKLYFLVFVLFVVAIGTFFYLRRQDRLDLIAQNEVFRAIYHFESEDYDKALHGDGTHKGFLQVIEEYTGTRTANAAQLYVGLCYMYQQKYHHALVPLSRFSASNSIVQARAWALMGDVYTEIERPKQASMFYIKAAKHRENSIYSPKYWIKAAIILEKRGKYKRASACYKQIIQKYPNSQYKELAIKEAHRLASKAPFFE